MKQLRKEVLLAKRSAYAPGTFSNLSTQLYSYYAFCELYGFNCFPVDAYILTLYAAFLARKFKSPQSVCNYVSGIKTIMEILDYPITVFSSPSLKLTLRGVSRLKQHKPKKASPITPNILLHMYSKLDLTVPFNAVTWALFLIAFFTMSRKSNLVLTKGSKLNHHILRKDLKLKNGLLLVKFKSSKTNQDGTRHHLVPLIPIQNSVLCPITAYKNMCSMVPSSNEKMPAFSFFTKKDKLIPYTYEHYMSSIKALCEHIGLKSHKYSTHSFRRGGASWAFSNSVPGELLKTHGDWKSDAYQKYLDFSLEQKVLVGLLMSNSL